MYAFPKKVYTYYISYLEHIVQTLLNLGVRWPKYISLLTQEQGGDGLKIKKGHHLYSSRGCLSWWETLTQNQLGQRGVTSGPALE